MANEAAKTQTINIVPVQGIFQPEPTFDLITLIGPAGTPFYAKIDPNQSGLNITNSTINSTTIGATTPSTGVFTNIATTTGTISSVPSSPDSIVNQAYVDAIAQGLAFKAPANYTTTGNITLSGLAVQGGGDWNVTLTAGMRILVINQTAGADNGIYLAAAGAWTRSLDANTYDELLSAYLFVTSGVTLAGSAWVDTNLPGGTLGVTPITFVRFSNTAVYSAGTGLTLSSYQFSITPVGTAGTYGSASAVPVFVTNASGQVTSVTNTAIAIANTQVSGLGTMSTQNANAVAITGGSINGTTVGATTAAAVTGTIVTANTYFSGAGTNLTGTASGLSIGGNAATATTAGSVTNSLTINSGGSGGTSPQTYNGGTAVTVSYNTVGAPSITGTNASGTWGISITGNSATVTNGLYSTGSYSNPTWLTSILGSIVSGAVATATTATNVTGGAAGSLVYQSGASTTTTLALGTTNYVLTAGASAPQYVAQSTLSVGSATTATTATNLAGGGAGYIPYQSGAGATAFLASGTTGQVLTSNGTSAPTWSTPSSYATVTDDTSTAATRYPLFANQTTGNLTTEYVSSTKLQYNPSTGVFTSTSFTGAGTGLTGTASGLSIGGNAATATSATSATTATNIAGGVANQIPYQTGVGATSFITAPTTASTSLTWNGSAFTWAAGSGGLTISDDTTTNATRYLTFTSATTGTITSQNVSSTKLQFNPSTGAFTSTSLTPTNAVGLSYGGTGQTTANASFNALAPSQTSNSGKYLTTDGTNTSWGTISVTPAAVSDQNNTSTGYFDLPAGTTAQRPGSPNTGMIRYNTTESKYEVYSGTAWQFLTSTAYPYNISYLVVAGGGGGGGQIAGGGGAGGLLYSASSSVTPGTTYTVTVGGGGAAGSGSSDGGLGNNSVFSSFTAIGGGAGQGGEASHSVTSNGGSGGGQGRTAAGRGGTAGTATSGQGNNGGSGSSSGGTDNNGSGAGGGGAGAVGGNASGGTGGSGGAGSANSITGSSVTYAGGGGGGTFNGTGGAGGSSIGGAGGNGNNASGSGTTNTGSGGGGGGYGTNIPGSGGSGVVILSIPTANYSGTTTGSPTVTTSGSNTILKFTGSGSYTA